MKALIIAAGMGLRLRSITSGAPKPLTLVKDLSLLERGIITASRGGIREFIIVVGYKGDRIREALGQGEELGVSITYLENPEWERGNGLSVLRAREVLDRPFLLMMADHLFDPALVSRAASLELAQGESALMVDDDPEEYIDLDDATKVIIREGRIVEIGKELPRYDALDCGLFQCSPALFQALEESIAAGEESLSGGMGLRARAGMLLPCSIRGGFWMDVDTEQDFRNATEILALREGSEGDRPLDGSED